MRKNKSKTLSNKNKKSTFKLTTGFYVDITDEIFSGGIVLNLPEDLTWIKKS